MKKIKLTQGQYALVDDEDFERVSQFKWYADWAKNIKSFYARTSIKKENGKQADMKMHRFIMSCSRDKEIDHKNHNTLDNQKLNLRICTYRQNHMNRRSNRGTSSEYKGVCWHIPSKKWRARIMYNGEHISLGLYKNEIDAAIAYNRKAKKLFGEFAYLNKL